ncbi:MAG TPA: patatin-like phospholipase family protein [Methylomirabilota bacterium]|nr:patatin-like phospholipase family protein [Methylomirabilota bacterium]
MPFGNEGVEPGIGLALSGGGFRATLFHCGALWRLDELGILARLDRVSSISGGSITAGVLAIRWQALRFHGAGGGNLRELVIEPLRAFCHRTVDAPAIGLGAVLPGRRPSDLLQAEYAKHLYGATTLRDLPDRPRFVFNATNLATGVSFRFSKPYAGDYRIGLIKDPAFPVALAVTASSAFPPFLSPVAIETEPSAFQRVEGADLFDQVAYRERLLLTDGGVYDNLGLETVWNRYDTILASDAGAPFGLQLDPETAWHSQVLRALDIATSQSRGLRKRALVDEYTRGARKGAYWGIDTDILRYGLSDALPVLPGRIRELAGLRTRLDDFTDAEQGRLINWGYAVCDAAMRRHVTGGTGPTPGWPVPELRLDQ